MDPLIRAVRTLTIAVWCLCGLLAIQLAFYGWGWFQSARVWRRTVEGADHASTTMTRGITPVSTDVFDGRQFHDLSPEEKIARSSAILLVSYQKEGERFKAVVAEILKLRSDAQLRYAVGDEMSELSYYPRGGEVRGEGQVVFLAGSPALLRSSYSFEAGRIGGMGDMPIDVLRQMVKAAKS
jgi:hypothetical protein